jgi:hypothetical protein
VYLEIVVYDEVGSQAGTALADCAEFEATIELPAGRFSADLTLLDDDDRPRSTTLTVSDLSVLPDEDLVVKVEFPSDSILAPR